jgi:glutaredoxin-like protein
MGLLGAADQERLRERFAGMRRPVRLLFFTQTLGCETCLQTRQILDELPLLSSQVTIEEINFVLEPDKAKQYEVDRVPAVALVGQDESGAERDSKIRFLGAPSGYEFASLVQAVLLVGGVAGTLSAESLTRVAAVTSPVTVRVFTTPTCPHCPRAVSVAHEMAFANPNITAFAVEATEFPDLARRYQVTGVPKTVVNAAGDLADPGDAVEILGALPPDDFVSQALASFSDNPQ